MSERIKVVFCTDGIFPHTVGGIQKHTRLLVEELAQMKVVDLYVIHQHHDKKVFDASLNVKEIGLQRGKQYWSYLYNEYRYSKQVYNELKKMPDAIVYAQGLSVWYNISKLKNKIIVNPHGLEFYQAITPRTKFKALRFAAIFNHLFEKATKVVSLGGRLTNLLHKNIAGSEHKVVVLPNAINLPEKKFNRTRFENKPMQILFVGRFAANKGINILMDAAQQLNRSGYINELQFHLVGKGPLFEHFTSTVKEPNIIYHGFADDAALNKLYEDSDIFVLPTFFEGMPTVVLEAMGYSLPIIVTDTGATTEMVDDNNGYIINKADVKSLVNAIVQFYQMDVAKKKQLADYSYKKVHDNFTWSVVAQKHYELFKTIAAGKT